MAFTKTAVAVLASTSVAAGGTKASPGTTGSSINCTTYYGGDLVWSITNGASAPGVALALTFQVSPDGNIWYDYYTVGGDLIASSVNSGTIPLDQSTMYLRVIAYNNTTNAVTAAVSLQAISSY
jgi:hypothetical protein